jgi:cytochrome c biogenesis factor
VEARASDAYSAPQRIARCGRHQEHTMFDNILSAVLTFSLMAAGTAAIGSELLTSRHRTQALTETQVVMLPTVTVTGHRATTVAYASGSAQVPHVQ